MFNFGFNSNGNQTGNKFGAKAATGGFNFGVNNATATENSGGAFLNNFNSTGGNTQNGGSGGLFGSQNNQSINGASFVPFGSNNATQNNTSGSLFGTNGNQQNNSTGGGLFGGSSNVQTNTQNNGSLTGGFGAQTGGTGLFSQNNMLNSSNTRSDLGGQFQQNNTNFIGTTSDGLFGQRSTPVPGTNTGSNFFCQQPLTNAPATGGMFDKPKDTFQSQPQQQQFSSVSAPTAVTTYPSFAWSQQPTQVGGSQQQSLQNRSQQLLNEQTHLPQQQPLQQQYSNYPEQIQEQILKCKESWDPSSQRSKLRTFVYNKCNETEAILYVKPANFTQEDWDKALADRPNANLIPIEVKGFEDLNQRHNLQCDHVAHARIILTQILEKLTNMSQKHELNTAARILKAHTRNSKIQTRIMKLATQIAVLKNKDLPLNVQEESLVTEFYKLLNTSNDPAGLGKNNELWARLAILKERAKTLSSQLDSTLVVVGENAATTTNPPKSNSEFHLEIDDKRIDGDFVDRVNKIADILMNQQRGLIYLNEVLQKDTQIIDKLLTK